MRGMKILSAIIALCALSMGSLRAEDTITVRGSSVVAVPLALMADSIKEAVGIEFKVVTDGGSSDAIFRMAGGYIDVALSTRYMTACEKAEYPDKTFKETLIGKQALGVVVSDTVWQSGIHALTKEQLRGIYEREITNWKQVGGEDRDLTYFNREVGRGAWDLFMIFLYGDARKAPLSKAEVLSDSGDVLTTIEFNNGAISIMNLSEVKGEGIHALGLKLADGTVVEPTFENIASGRYELSRPLLAITGRQPTGKHRKFLDFLIGEKGQAVVKKAGCVTNAELKAAK
jgi:phosphate transport system substrate-binding protein